MAASVATLSCEQRSLFTKLFEALDQNGDNRVDAKELRHLHLAITGKRVAPSYMSPYARKQMKKIDTDHDGCISLDEWLAFCVPLSTSVKLHELREMFTTYTKRVRTSKYKATQAEYTLRSKGVAVDADTWPNPITPLAKQPLAAPVCEFDIKRPAPVLKLRSTNTALGANNGKGHTVIGAPRQRRQAVGIQAAGTSGVAAQVDVVASGPRVQCTASRSGASGGHHSGSAGSGAGTAAAAAQHRQGVRWHVIAPSREEAARRGGGVTPHFPSKQRRARGSKARGRRNSTGGGLRSRPGAGGATAMLKARKKWFW